MQRLPHYIQSEESLHAAITTAQQYMEGHCSRVVCAVCGCYCPSTETTQNACDDIKNQLHIIRTEHAPENWDFITHCLIKGKDYRLQSAGVNTADDDVNITICKTCMNELQQNTIPKRSLKSFDAGPWPTFLPHDLSLLETIVCAPTRMHRYCVTLHPLTRGTIGFQGLRSHVVAVPKATPVNAQGSFPLPLDNLPAELSVVLLQPVSDMVCAWDTYIIYNINIYTA